MNASNAQLSLYHPNGKGTGCAIKMKLVPAHGLDAGYIAVTIAPQLAVADTETGERVYPRFDWDNALTENLAFDDLTKLLQVFRGETESINEGKGLFHRYADKCRVIKFRHMIEPVCGYSLEVCETSTEYGSESGTYIFLSTAEALGLSLAIEHSFAAIAFGVADGWEVAK